MSCFDWFKKLKLFSYVLNMEIDVVPKASRAVVIRRFSLNEAPLGLFKFISDYLPYFDKNKYIFQYYKCGHRNVLSKRQVQMSIFHIINFKKKFMDTCTGVLDFFDKKLILDYYFCLKSGPVFLFQIFIIALLPL